MAVEMLIRATDNGEFLKGNVIVIRETPWNWGTKESLPDFVVIRVTDAKLSDVRHYTEKWMEDYDVLETDENTKYQIKPKYAEKVTVPSISLKQAADINEVLSSQIKVSSVGVVTKPSDISFPKSTIKKADIEREINDILKKPYKHRRYGYSEIDIAAYAKDEKKVEEITLKDLNLRMTDRMN